MPTLADLEAARPKCPSTAASYTAAPSALCGKPMLWNDAAERWECPKHGAQLSGQIAAERVRT